MTSQPPLQGVVVLDFTQHLAGPFATMILGDLGARVIKVEPVTGDPARRAGPFRDGDSAYFHAINRGKESAVADLRTPEGVDAVRRLLAHVDCVVENFRPGVMDRLGLGPDVALEANPRLVYASCSGFGAEGPYASRGAYDVVVQAMGGVMSVTGSPDGAPSRVGVSQGDIVGGVYTAMAVLAALLRRTQTDRGAYIDVSMLEAQMSLATHAFGIWAATGLSPERIGNRHPAVAPFDLYPTADGFVAIAAFGDERFGRLCEALALEHLLGDDRFATAAGRLEHVEALTAAIAAATSEVTSDALVERLLAAAVPCGPLMTVADLVEDPHVRAQGSLADVAPWGGGGLPVPTLPFRLDGERWPRTAPGPELGSCGLEQLEAELHAHH